LAFKAGTGFALLIWFLRRWIGLAAGVARADPASRLLAVSLVIAFVPTALLGFYAKKSIVFGDPNATVAYTGRWLTSK
jgi:undecaprenyl pyrophosphate phosphatase UppP